MQVNPELVPDQTAHLMAETFKVLADASRLRLISALLNGEQCVSTLAEWLGMTQSAVSHQLRILRNMHFVSARKDGKQVFYHIDDEHIGDLFQRSLEHTKHI